MLKVLATSDRHGFLYEPPKKGEDFAYSSIEPCDLLIIAGDSCPVVGSHEPSVQYRWLSTTFRMWLEDIPAKEVILIAGNHDFVFEKMSRELIEKALPDKVTYLQDQSYEWKGFNFWGTPWVPFLHHWAFYGDSDKLHSKFFMIPPRTDVLISHGPPKGFTDGLVNSYEHVGSEEMLQQILRVNPKLFICGHVHEGFGHRKVPGTQTELYNVAYLDRSYEPTHYVVDISEHFNATND